MSRLLLVDDDAAQLELWKLVLRRSMHEVEAVSSPDEAVARLDGFQPEVLVTDLHLPEVEDGLRLIRKARECCPGVRIVVLSGWPANVEWLQEQGVIDRMLHKPVRARQLLETISELLAFVLLLLSVATDARAEVFHFTVKQPAEVVAELQLSSPGSDWSQPEHEAALANLLVDDRAEQHVMLYAGATRYTYAAFLGNLPAGEHQLRIDRNAKYSAKGSGLQIHGARFREATNDAALAHAPILYARVDTVGGFNDVPLLSYCERLREDGRDILQYTVIFSNEDGGTSTRALMARWGRTTDIEYIYRAWLDGHGEVERATIQAANHEEIAFRGRREGTHPILIPSTKNNMVAAEGESAIRYQIPPITVDLSRRARESVMRDRPVLYRVMAQELAREDKLRPFGQVDGQKISDPRNYLYVEAAVTNQASALAVMVRLRNQDSWRMSHLGRADYAIARSGWFQTTVELPPGTTAADLAEIGFACFTSPEMRDAAAGVCTVQRVAGAFLLDRDYKPGPDIWTHAQPERIVTGEMRVFHVFESQPASR